jgi:hypothetical protein
MVCFGSGAQALKVQIETGTHACSVIMVWSPLSWAVQNTIVDVCTLSDALRLEPRLVQLSRLQSKLPQSQPRTRPSRSCVEWIYLLVVRNRACCELHAEWKSQSRNFTYWALPKIFVETSCKFSRTDNEVILHTSSPSLPVSLLF